MLNSNCIKVAATLTQILNLFDILDVCQKQTRRKGSNTLHSAGEFHCSKLCLWVYEVDKNMLKMFTELLRRTPNRTLKG